MMRRVGERLGILAFTVGTLLVTTMVGTATAHDWWAAWHGDDKAWVDGGHSQLFVQDGECDGNNAYAEGYDYRSGRSYLVSIWDPDGCKLGTGYNRFFNIYMFRVCENRVGCSAWQQP